MALEIYTDGGAINNPGRAAIAYVCFINKRQTTQYSEKIGTATNNIAEYKALIKALEYVKHLARKPEKVIVYSDSRLMVNQVRGLFKIKNGALRELFFNVKMLEQELGVSIEYHNIPREQNKHADSLVKKELF